MKAITVLLSAFVFLRADGPNLARAEPSSLVARLIEQAGNTEDERERLSALAELARLLDVDETLSEESKAMASFVRAWNDPTGRLNFFSEAMAWTASDAVGEYDFHVRAESPLRPIAELYRGRMLAWYLLESGNQQRADPERYLRYKTEALRSFRLAETAFPKNRLPGMYRGHPIAWPKRYRPVSGAPQWAVLQREHLERLRDIILWWVEHRQRPDGSFGGGWGDDVEMWRWWSPILLGFDEPEIIAAQLRLSRGCLERPELKAGFLDQVRDVEHGAEESTDSLVPLLVLQPEERRWREASGRLVDILSRVWLGRNQRDELQFRSFHFGATGVSPAPEHAFDVPANAQALGPALRTWLTTRDPALGRRLTAWLDTWVAATARAENGKPAGILPAALHWPDGRAAGGGEGWWEPVARQDSMYHYYLWPSILTEMTDALLVAHVVTGEQKYLAPLRSMAAVRLKYLRNPPPRPPTPGSEAWCAAELAPRPNSHNNYGGLVKSLARCKALTQSEEFDELLALEDPEHVVGSGMPNRTVVEQALRAGVETLRVNFPAYTSEVRYTDRVLRFVQFVATDNLRDEYRGVTLPKYELLYRMVTGDGNAARFPLPAVRWRTPAQDFAAWVTLANRTRLEAELFHFGLQPRQMQAELLGLTPGRYHLELLHEGRAINRSDLFQQSSGPPSTITIELPPQQPCVLRITRDPSDSSR